jgi:hypothetical protein
LTTPSCGKGRTTASGLGPEDRLGGLALRTELPRSGNGWRDGYAGAECHCSTSVSSEDTPTAMQNPEPMHDAPFRRLPFGKVCPGGLGLFILAHLMPFQLRIRVLVPIDPTAMQSVVVPHETPLRLLMPSRVRTTDQEEPLHCSINVRRFWLREVR